jgi:hypothetical protein
MMLQARRELYPARRPPRVEGMGAPCSPPLSLCCYSCSVRATPLFFIYLFSLDAVHVIASNVECSSFFVSFWCQRVSL